MFSPDISRPLIAINAVAIDTEATGLDPARARIVEIGAVHIIDGVLDPTRSFRILVNPEEPVPPAAAVIHGLTNEKLVSALVFRNAWPEAAEFARGSIWIGHTLGFDLALLSRECARSRLPFDKPPVLDTRLLAQIAEPNLSGYTLESLAAWLGVESAGRHAALGDAITTARIFLALLPRLRDRGVRTIGEALLASSRLTEVIDRQHGAGWEDVTQAPKSREEPLELRRLDSHPYRRRSRDIMHAPPVFLDRGKSVKEALEIMTSHQISSVFIKPADKVTPLAKDCGIVTERDVMRALAAQGAAALDLQVDNIMSHPLATVPGGAFLYVAIARLNRLRIRHLGVVNSAGEITGALSARDLLRSSTGQALSLGDEVASATSSRELAVAWAQLPRICAALSSDDMEGRELAAIISHELRTLTAQAAVIAERQMQEEGRGAAPCPYAVLVLGSAGRDESLLAMDQDNALVFAEGEPGSVQDQWFEALGERFANLLHEAGVPLCKGGVMAKNPQWRGSVATWHERIATWLDRSNPADLLSVDTFFDLHGVHGAGDMANALRTHAYESAKDRFAFAKLLVDATAPMESGLRLFGRLRTSEGRIDLKKSGLFRIVCTARALAIRHNITARSTPRRLQEIRALDLGSDRDLEALIEAQALFLDLIVRQQIADIASGKPPSNAVEVARLSRQQRERLVEALRSMETLETLVRDLMFES